LYAHFLNFLDSKSIWSEKHFNIKLLCTKTHCYQFRYHKTQESTYHTAMDRKVPWQQWPSPQLNRCLEVLMNDPVQKNHVVSSCGRWWKEVWQRKAGEGLKHCHHDVMESHQRNLCLIGLISSLQWTAASSVVMYAQAKKKQSQKASVQQKFMQCITVWSATELQLQPTY
jgi:hypothetical protein